MYVYLSKVSRCKQSVLKSQFVSSPQGGKQDKKNKKNWKTEMKWHGGAAKYITESAMGIYIFSTEWKKKLVRQIVISSNFSSSPLLMCYLIYSLSTLFYALSTFITDTSTVILICFLIYSSFLAAAVVARFRESNNTRLTRLRQTTTRLQGTQPPT